jgi:hypothetical protein
MSIADIGRERRSKHASVSGEFETRPARLDMSATDLFTTPTRSPQPVLRGTVAFA